MGHYLLLFQSFFTKETFKVIYKGNTKCSNYVHSEMVTIRINLNSSDYIELELTYYKRRKGNENMKRKGKRNRKERERKRRNERKAKSGKEKGNIERE